VFSDWILLDQGFETTPSLRLPEARRGRRRLACPVAACALERVASDVLAPLLINTDQAIATSS